MASKTDEISTNEAENVDDSQSVSEVANTQTQKSRTGGERAARTVV